MLRPLACGWAAGTLGETMNAAGHRRKTVKILTAFVMMCASIGMTGCDNTMTQATATERALCEVWGQSLPTRSRADTAPTQQAIQRALGHLSHGRTTFVIAHRLSTVRRADKIVVIDDGEVVEEGRHDALMHHDGRYKEMVTRQLVLDQAWPEDGEHDWSGYLP